MQLTKPKSLILALTLACTGLLLLPGFGAAQGVLGTVKDKVKSFTDPRSTLEEDNHPEVPWLHTLLGDTNLFRLTSSKLDYHFSIPTILKSGLIIYWEEGSAWQLVTPDMKPVHRFSSPSGDGTYPADLDPIYVDAVGNVYLQGKRYLYPDYKIATPFPILNIRDSLFEYQRQCKLIYPTSTPEWKGCVQDHIHKLQAQAGLPDCYHFWMQQCDFFGVSNGYFVIEELGRQEKCDFTMEGEPFATFDQERKVDYSPGGGRVGIPYFVWMKYVVTPKGQRFKYTRDVHPRYFTIQGKHYLITSSGMYEML